LRRKLGRGQPCGGAAEHLAEPFLLAHAFGRRLLSEPGEHGGLKTLHVHIHEQMVPERWPMSTTLAPESRPATRRRLHTSRHASGRLATMTEPTVPDELSERVPDVASLREAMSGAGYLTDDGLASALFCAVRLPQPVLLEGEAGVGKTEAAKALATALDTPLVRLQCYEGIDAAEALYEWNYPRQLLGIRMAEAAGTALAEDDLFGPEYLIARPLLRAVRHPGPRPVVLLIDEVDRADDEFEAFLFELLAESSVTIPELGTIHAKHPPIVVLTSNRTRDLHDALKRRCLYHWIDYPTIERAVAIIRARVPSSTIALTEHVASAVSRLRTLDLQKPPGIAEAIGWVQALSLLGFEQLDVAAVERTLGSVLKYREDTDEATARGLAWVAAG